TLHLAKSTLTQPLPHKLNFTTSFQNLHHNPYLHKFYNHFEPSSFHLQIYFLPQPFKQQKPIFEYAPPFIQHPSIYQ
ncbi:deoxynucleoside kinase, partial [Staphylococcus hominis]|uniref:deoxynucleoside kinase n=1 Tax=Staphylococcus hominis TaxID=1290 RepID=UPI001643D268